MDNQENQNEKIGNQEADAAQIDADRSGFIKNFREIWSDTVGNYATDEGETRNLFSRFVDFGTLSAEEAKKLFSEASETIERNRVEFDVRIDESIQRATARFSPISTEDIQQLNTKLSEMEERLTDLEGNQN
jgi:polyhydroxyalkanoate synthesis regulator phasin